MRKSTFILVLMFAVATASAQDRPTMPAPTPAIALGTHTLFLVDERRPEIVTDAEDDHRRLVVQLWYPSSSRGKRAAQRADRAAYLPDYETLAPALSEVYRQHGTALASLRVPAVRDAGVRGGKRLPLVVFSPGLGTSRLFYTSQILAIASRGFVVAAVDHTYDVEGVVCPGPSLVRRSDPTASEIEGTPKPGEGLRAGPRLRVWAADLAFVLDRVLALDTKKGLFRGRLDKSRVAMVGHCFGGRAALLAASTDRRVRAVVVENAWPLAEESCAGKLRGPVLVAQGAKTKEVMWLRKQGAREADVAKLRDGAAAQQRTFLERLGVPVTRVEFAEQEHMDFTDLPMLGAWVTAGDTARGPERNARRDLVDAWIGDFLESALLKRKKPRLEVEAGSHPGYWLQRITPGAVEKR